MPASLWSFQPIIFKCKSQVVAVSYWPLPLAAVAGLGRLDINRGTCWSQHMERGSVIGYEESLGDRIATRILYENWLTMTIGGNLEWLFYWMNRDLLTAVSSCAEWYYFKWITRILIIHYIVFSSSSSSMRVSVIDSKCHFLSCKLHKLFKMVFIWIVSALPDFRNHMYQFDTEDAIQQVFFTFITNTTQTVLHSDLIIKQTYITNLV